ncbi:uncharacterized protein Dana_GF22570 [Drosophila ananassae]|uniref:Uncharacterized protein n=1 Tax=Drosophila ananassae TaxID=7217 RepID=B3MVV3_DROAN|nr:uncharacterized protein LOC6505227 [Drosophila ananassae]EDV35098.1 uncharacterized protein Dana_GF22570 [Drosophila ananassae]
MPSAPSPLLLLPLLILAQCLLAATQVAPPRLDLQTPNFDGESFERFDGNGRENSAEMREQLKQLLGEQLANAFAPLATTPFSNLAQRQPAIVAPTSGEAARAQFSGESTSSEEAEAEAEHEEEEESPEDDSSSEEEPAKPPTPQPALPPQLPQPVGTVDPNEDQDPEPVEDYNAWRDNFYDLNEDGSYIFGYALPHGVRRWERGYFPEDHHGQVVEGFYVQPRHVAHGLRYELRCYRADSEGYHPLPVEFLRNAPIVRRDERPQVDCFNNFVGRRL